MAPRASSSRAKKIIQEIAAESEEEDYGADKDVNLDEDLSEWPQTRVQVPGGPGIAYD